MCLSLQMKQCEGPALTMEEGEDRERKKTEKDREDLIRKRIGIDTSVINY